MNGKLRVAAIGLSLSVAAMLLLLVVRPSLDPAQLRPLPLIIGAWLAFLTAAWLLRTKPAASNTVRPIQVPPRSASRSAPAAKYGVVPRLRAVFIT